MTAPLRVSYVGGCWDGMSYLSSDDQVPAMVASGDWQHYRLTERTYDDGLLVEAVYRYAPELDS